MTTVFVSEEEAGRIRDAIREIESQTSGELVTVIAAAADDYHFIPMLWATLAAFLIPGSLYFLPLVAGVFKLGGWGVEPSFWMAYTIQMAVFIVLALLFQWWPLRIRLIPGYIKHRRARRLAYEQFVMQGVHLTSKRTGILFFVSVAEHYVEIIADQGIASKVDNAYWQAVVDEFIRQVRAGQVAEGFLMAIEKSGKTLIEHFPAEVDNINELPDHLVRL